MTSPLIRKAPKPLILASPPHIRSTDSAGDRAWTHVLALFPVVAASIVIFGWKALLIFSVASVSTVTLEWMFERGSRIKLPLGLGDSIVAAWLFACLMPEGALWWMVAFGSAVMVLLGRRMFGGLGQNIFHPALAAAALLTALFPSEIAFWAGSDAAPEREIWTLLAGVHSGPIGETSALAILTGGAVLAVRRLIAFDVPFLFLGAVAGSGLLFGRDPFYELLSGGVFLGAFFLVTDSVTTPISKSGRRLFALAAGVLTMVFRQWTDASASVVHAVLIMNGSVPLIDWFLQPKPGQPNEDR